MYFDALTTAAVADECRTLIGGRVQQVVQVDEWSVSFEIYAGHCRQYVLASAHPQHSRVHLTQVKPRRGVETPSPLLLLLRKYVRSGRITAVHNPEFERILELEIASTGPASAAMVTLVVEAMGRHANVILLDAGGTVMDAIKHVGPQLSRVRPILPGRPYVFPPPQAKLDPTDVTELRLRKMMASAEPTQPAWRILVSGIRAVSPLLAREIVHRVTGNALTSVEEMGTPMGAHTERGAPPAPISPLLEAFQGLLMHVWEHDWQPCVALKGNKVIAFAPYVLTQYPEHETAGTISMALDRYYGSSEPGHAYAPAKAAVRAALDGARKRVASRRGALERQLVTQEELDRLRLCGEMILAYAHAVQPGDERLEAQANLDGPPLIIDLDPRLKPIENAQAYFQRYDKAKSAMAEIPDLLARADLELVYLAQLATDLELATRRPEIEEVRSALVEAGYMPRPKGPKPQRGQPLQVATEEGMTILVGRSARQNHEVTFRRAGPDDLWLHVVDAPGSHVVVLSGGRPVSDTVLRRAAELAAYYSAVRGETSVSVAYTQRRYVRPMHNARPGMVTYRREKTIRVGARAGD